MTFTLAHYEVSCAEYEHESHPLPWRQHGNLSSLMEQIMVHALESEGLLSRYFRSLQANIDLENLEWDTSNHDCIAVRDQRQKETAHRRE